MFFINRVSSCYDGRDQNTNCRWVCSWNTQSFQSYPENAHPHIRVVLFPSSCHAQNNECVVTRVAPLLESLFGGKRLLVYPWLKTGPPLAEMVVLTHRARSFRRHAHAAVRAEGHPPGQSAESTLEINTVADVPSISPSRPTLFLLIS